MIFARGPDVATPATPGPISVNDVTPTILSWMGIPPGADMDGRPAPFLDVEPIDPIPTHDTGAIECLDTRDSASGTEGEILEQLRSLGYFETDSGRPAQPAPLSGSPTDPPSNPAPEPLAAVKHGLAAWLADAAGRTGPTPVNCFGYLDHELPLRIQRTDTLTTQWEPPWLKH